MKLLAALVGALCLGAGDVAAQGRDDRVAVTASGGIAHLSRGEGKPAAGLIGVDFWVTPSIAIGVEAGMTGPSEDVDHVIRNVERLRKRNEISYSAFVKMRALNRDAMTIDGIVGMTRLDWKARDSTRFYTFEGPSPWGEAPGLVPPVDEPVWALAVGFDAAIGRGSIAFVPGFRIAFPGAAPEPSLRSSVGVRVRF